ncbi:19093_t:CDS:2, partial [Racocetra fulgida]
PNEEYYPVNVISLRYTPDLKILLDLKQKDNSNTDCLIDEFSPAELQLDYSSQQSRKLSTIEEKTELVTTIKESKLASRLFRPTSTLSKSSSSDGSNELDIKDLAASEEEKIDQEDSFVTKQNRRVYNSIDAFSRILEERDINVLATEKNGEGDGNSENKDISNNSTCRTNINLSIPTIFTSEHSPTDISSILLPSISDLDSVHSDKSILSDTYSAIKDDHSDVSVSLYPSPVPISNVTPLRNFKDGRI